MSPRFYGFLWVLFAVSAGILWLAGVFSMLTLVVFGFIAFGLVFVGMMCVLPGNVSHPVADRKKTTAEKKQPRAAREKVRATPVSHIHFPAGIRFH